MSIIYYIYILKDLYTIQISSKTVVFILFFEKSKSQKNTLKKLNAFFQ